MGQRKQDEGSSTCAKTTRSVWMDTWTFNEFDFSSYDVFLCNSLSNVRRKRVLIFLLHKCVLKLSCRRGRLSHKIIGMETVVRGCGHYHNTLATENFCPSAFNWLNFTVKGSLIC